MRTKWNTETYICGIVTEGETISGTFRLVDDSHIVKASPSCGCTTVSFDHNSKEINFEYKTEKVPTHLRTQGYYHVNKKIIVEVDNPDMKYKQQCNLYIHAEIRTKEYGRD